MTLPIYDEGVASGLLCGLLFGYVLESAGLASPRKITAQFRFTDWTVFKVMFTAIVVSAAGLAAATAMGWLPAGSVFIPTTYFWAILTGGILLGAGMALGGYCPGTSAVALGTGRLDSVFFMIGMVLGTGLFAAVYEPIKDFYVAAQGPQAQTLSALLGIPVWAVLAILVIVGALGFALGAFFERRSGGPLTAAQLTGDADGATVEEIEIVSIRNT
ncbi:MAG TPA: DUF6691 family protein [Pseudolabrys sp.]|nr:DUF6691 family protein [Pseudolabrys sp.]